MKVAYMMSRFPKLTETFILYEMLALERLGVEISLYPLLREWAKEMHPESQPYVKRANYVPLVSRPIILANLHYLLSKPGAYLSTFWALVKNNLGSMRFLSRAMAVFPKSVYMALRMQQEHIDHIHAHFASHPAAAAYIIHRLTGIPYSFTAHGSDIHRDRHMLREKVARASFVVPISSFNRQVILDECAGRYAEKLVVVHCGVDTQAFRPNGRDWDAPTLDPFSILCIGTLHEVKGQAHLIEACRLLAAKGITFICRFVGDGPDRAALETKVEQAGLSVCVQFLGRKTRNEVIALLHSADVLAAPSVPSKDGRKEGIPVVLMEAMASGVPVIASRLSGIPELVEDGREGLLIPPGDEAQLAAALERLAKDPELKKCLSQEGRKKVEREFDLRSSAAELVRLFQTEALA
jgi:glycosyltransferase involved in cell wall biosynthesis